MIFYRLQDREWELEKDWQSYCYRWDSLEQAMLSDIEDEWEMTDLAEKLKERYEDEEIREAWWNLVREGNKPLNAHTGASCFVDIQRMKDYIEKESSYYNNDEYEIVEFEGTWAEVPEGMDREDIAIVKNEIRRISIKDFMEV